MVRQIEASESGAHVTPLAEQHRLWRDAADTRTLGIVRTTQVWLDSHKLPSSHHDLGSQYLETRKNLFTFRFSTGTGSEILDVKINRTYVFPEADTETGKGVRSVGSTTVLIGELSGTTKIRFEPEATKGIEQMRESYAALDHYPRGTKLKDSYEDDRDCYEVGYIVRGEVWPKYLKQDFQGDPSLRVDVWDNAERVLEVLQNAKLEGLVDPQTQEVTPIVLSDPPRTE